MASYLEGLTNKIAKFLYDKEPKQPSHFTGLSKKEKLQQIAVATVLSERELRLRHHQLWYLLCLYYQGYQNIEVNPVSNTLDVFEREDFYVENQFRKDVITNIMSLNRSEGEVTTRPSSNKPNDIAASRVGADVLPVMHENIGYPRLRTTKNLYKCLMGNAFIFTDYVVDKKYGTVITPKFEYQDMEMPGGALCPDCGMTSEFQTPECPACGSPMQQEPPSTITSKVEAGFEERARGQEISVVCSPLEVEIGPAYVKHFDDISYLRWKARVDADLIDYMYPDMGYGPSSGHSKSENDLADQYLANLGNLPGNILGEGTSYTHTGGRSQVLHELIWLKPELFRGEKDLLKEFPDGARVTLVNGRITAAVPEDLHKRWTHELYLPNPHSVYGDGMYDAIQVQDQINEINSLLIKHMRYTTVQHTIYDANIIDIQKVINNPEFSWIPANTQVDKTVQDAAKTLPPGQLSGDTGAWKMMLKESMQDMSGAWDAGGAKGSGANAPYSKEVFHAERTQARHQPSNDYNQPMLIRFTRQLLDIAQENWLEERSRKLIDNTGNWSFMAFSGADLAQGSMDVIVTNTDFSPKTRTEKFQALEAYAQMAPFIATLAPKQKLRIDELFGLPPDANPVSGQIARASRIIERLKKGEPVIPLLLADDPAMQIPVFQEFIISEDGEQLAEQQSEIFAAIYGYMTTLFKTLLMQQASGIGGPPTPLGTPPNAGSPPNPQNTNKQAPGGQMQNKTPVAQAPVPEEMKQPMPPPVPAGAGRGNI